MKKEEWLGQMQKLLNKTPKGHWLFCDGNLHLMKYAKEGGRAVDRLGNMDQDYIEGSLNGPEMDGGDW